MSSIPIQKSADYCTYCPKMCHFSCPVAEIEKNEAYTPWGKQQTAKLIREKSIPLNSENAFSAYKCLTCRSSQSFCDHEIVVADSLQQIREMAVESETAPDPVLQFEGKFKKHQNPYSIDLQEKLLKNVNESFCRPKKEVLFFATCHLLAQGDSFVQKTFKLFDKY
jgi:Fe-S oxidoreductase